MGMKSYAGKAGKLATGLMLPKVIQAAPGLSHAFVREALNRAISGVGPLPSAAAAAQTQLDKNHGNVEKAIKDVIRTHATYAGAEGFATNLGGLVTMAFMVPANITGLALIQARMIAAIAHLRGYDLADPRVRNAVLASLLGAEKVEKLVASAKLPAPPMALATAPVHDPLLAPVIAAEVAGELIGKVAGRRLVTTVGRKVPVMGGAVGASADALVTWQVGRYAAKELRSRVR